MIIPKGLNVTIILFCVKIGRLAVSVKYHGPTMHPLCITEGRPWPGEDQEEGPAESHDWPKDIWKVIIKDKKSIKYSLGEFWSKIGIGRGKKELKVGL